MIWLYMGTVFVAGCLIATQAGVNSSLARVLGHPVLAATASFLVGTTALVLCSLGLRRHWPAPAAVEGAPWWIWTGGLLGAFFVVTAAALAPRLGAATLLGLAVAGQLTFAIVLDHYGLVGFPVRHVTPWRVLGAGLLMAGTIMIRRC